MEIPKGKIQGFKKFDKVIYLGKEYWIKGRMTSGYAVLMGIDGEKVTLKPIPKFKGFKRIGARKACVIALIVPTSPFRGRFSLTSIK